MNDIIFLSIFFLIIQSYFFYLSLQSYVCTLFLHITTHTSLSPIRHGFASGFVNYKKGCTRLAATSDKVCQLLAHGRWFSPGPLASSTTKIGRHDIAEILLKVALNTKNQIKSNHYFFTIDPPYNELLDEKLNYFFITKIDGR